MAGILPLKYAYKIAVCLSDVYYRFAFKDKDVVKNNIRRVLGYDPDEKTIDFMARSVFHNFAKYLVDFFKVPSMGKEYIRSFVKCEGLENVDKALEKGKGAIMLSAHIGNWEIGGACLGARGYSISAVVLTHQNKRINELFRMQREKGGLKPIEIGITLKGCYRALKNNELLALLGDRDFTKNGLRIEFFGKKVSMPMGPAVLSNRLGAAIVPSFVVRQKDDTLKITFEDPIYPGSCDAETLAKKYLAVIERYIRENPTQWYVFKDLWSENELLCPDTII